MDVIDFSGKIAVVTGGGAGIGRATVSAFADLGATVIALEEVLTRWPDWEVDYDAATRAHTTSVRGWAAVPVSV